MVLYVHVSLPANGILISSSVFAKLTNVPNKQTDTQTMEHVTHIAIGCIYAMHVMRPIMDMSAL